MSERRRKIKGVRKMLRQLANILESLANPITPPSSPKSKNKMAEETTPSKLNRAGSLQAKRKPEDFIFGKVIGEGSFSTVILAKEVSTDKQYAIKVLDKQHIIRENKAQYVHREKSVLSKLNHPFFVKLYYTFQDKDRLYFVLSYAGRGELLDYIQKLGSFDENCTRFYAAEVVSALEHLHGLGIIHRDLKPENILFNEQMHIQITDFGSSKILKTDQLGEDSQDGSQVAPGQKRKNSFVGTAQYVSPEVLTSKKAYYSSDLWALGCIIYQLLSGLPPFRGGHEYQIFQKITKLEYEFPEGFSPTARDLVEKLLVLEPEGRLGCEEMGGFDKLKKHPFFEGVDWSNLSKQKPPQLVPFLPAKDKDSESVWSTQYKPGLDDQKFSELIGLEISAENTEEESKKATELMSQEKRAQLLEEQKSNEYNRFVEGNLILKQGLVDKRKGLFARRRMFLLTEGPHLYYVDPANMELKGQIPWSKELRPEAKNFKIFFVHTPNRTYYLEDPSGNSLKWCDKLEEVYQQYYGPRPTSDTNNT
ncbi:unnamed protein product [Owenia fusiformis]|uniref:3-phosphoinositide-dependent protein kinase 1 n=1 Tax=Owenia fusiformis TaxID=6347 RepID=A0A8J1U9N2_OWEFU|nr:unnamed protein product [Owenia fusiformis]